MDAGIPVREHVAGVSVGLVSETDPTTGDISSYRILTDILVSLRHSSFSLSVFGRTISYFLVNLTIYVARAKKSILN